MMNISTSLETMETVTNTNEELVITILYDFCGGVPIWVRIDIIIILG